MTFYTAVITLILVMDPVGNVPVFLAILKKFSIKQQARIILRESGIAFIILAVFLFFGRYILNGLKITDPALSIAGGIILFIIAIRMIFPPEAQKISDDEEGEEPFIVPLAIPLTAGPSAIATVMLLASQSPNRIGFVFFALLISSVIFTIVLLCSPYLMKVLGYRGLIALERLMGMLLTTAAVQMFLTGIQTYFHL